MRPSELEGKQVIEEGAKIVGTVASVEIVPMDWKVTHLHVELTSELVQFLGIKKPFIGHVEILLPVDAVKAVSDVITLNKSMKELREFLPPPK